MKKSTKSGSSRAGKKQSKRRNPTSLTLIELLEIANKVYDDGYLVNFYTKTGAPKRGTGDTLAKFIVIELRETFDPSATKQAQLYQAMQVMESAQYQLADVKEAFERAYDRVSGNEIPF